MSAEGLIAHVLQVSVMGPGAPGRLDCKYLRNLYGQTLPAFSASPAQDQPAALGCHPDKKAVSPLPLFVCYACQILFHYTDPTNEV